MPKETDIPQPSHDDALLWENRRSLLIGLTATAGWLDALAFLHLDKVFVSFMSGNLLFVGIGAGDGDGTLVAHALVVLLTFCLATAIVARFTGRQLDPGAREPLRGMLLLEAALLALFAVLWLAVDEPRDHQGMTYALLIVGAAAMGLQAAIALAFHIPNVATVAITATLAQLSVLAGSRRREGAAIASSTAPVPLMIALSLAYLISALIVGLFSSSAVVALGPLLLVTATVAMESRRTRDGSPSFAAP